VGRIAIFPGEVTSQVDRGCVLRRLRVLAPIKTIGRMGVMPGGTVMTRGLGVKVTCRTFR
jgi:hypothetical protein